MSLEVILLLVKLQRVGYVPPGAPSGWPPLCRIVGSRFCLVGLPPSLGGEGLGPVLGCLAGRRKITPSRGKLQALLLEALIGVLDVRLEPIEHSAGIGQGPAPDQGVVAHLVESWLWRNYRNVPSWHHHSGRTRDALL